MNTNASRDIFTDLKLRISFSCLTGDKAFRFRFHGRRTFELINTQSCNSAPMLIQRSAPTRIEQDLSVADAGRATVRAKWLAVTLLCDSRDLQRGWELGTNVAS
jgi:hypothetical protein